MPQCASNRVEKRASFVRGKESEFARGHSAASRHGIETGQVAEESSQRGQQGRRTRAWHWRSGDDVKWFYLAVRCQLALG